MTTKAGKSTIIALVIIVFLVLALFANVGCQHIGPGTIVDDRLGYNRKILSSWEEQTLLNIVRVRYGDLVSFVDVSGVTQTHTRQDSISASLMASLMPWHIHKDTITPSVTGSRMMTDSPAITYTPLTSAEFTRNLNAPLRPSQIFNLIESGYRPELLLNLTLYSVNEIASSSKDDDRSGQQYPLHLRWTSGDRFIKLMKAIKCAYGHSGDLNFLVQPSADTKDDRVYMIISDKDSDGACTDGRPRPVEYIRESLHLRAAANQFEIVPEPRPRNENEVAVRTRSVIAAMIWLSNYVELPSSEISELNIRPNVGLVPDRPLTVEVDAPTERRRDALAAVSYRKHWFSIPQDNPDSKSSLIYLRILLALADTGPKPPPPALTIPTR